MLRLVAEVCSALAPGMALINAVEVLVLLFLTVI